MEKSCGTSNNAMKGKIMRKLRIGLWIGLGWLCIAVPSGHASSVGVWNPSVTVANIGGSTASGSFGSFYYSSTTLQVTFVPPPPRWLIHHFRVCAIYGSVPDFCYVGNPPGARKTVTLTGLRSGTLYKIEPRACLDPMCTDFVSAIERGDGATPFEAWQLQGDTSGTGNFDDVTKVISDGQTLSFAMRVGSADIDGDGVSDDGKVFFAYSPNAGSTWGAGYRSTLTLNPSPALSELLNFDSVPPVDDAGVRRECGAMYCDSSVGAIGIFAFQLVPLESPANYYRLFFEGMKYDATTTSHTSNRFYSIDSALTGTGQIFNRAGGACGIRLPTTSTDYVPVDADYDMLSGRDCEPTVEIDTTSVTGMDVVRQSKLGYPYLTDWLWKNNSASNSFMIVGGDAAGACNGGSDDGLYFAPYNHTSKTFSVLLDTTTACPQVLVGRAHGPVIVHLGDSVAGTPRYKLYFENGVASDRNKSFKIMYAYGATPQIQFGDWESHMVARDVEFLWPNGMPLSRCEESSLGDHTVLLPYGSTANQYMYMNLGGHDGCTLDPSEMAPAPDALGMAVLLNP